MKFFKYAFLGLFSLGFLGVIVAMIGVFAVFKHYGSDLPDIDQLQTYEPPIVSRVYAGNGQLLAEFAEEKRVFVPIENIPELVKNSFIAAEDQNFYTHQGVDLTAVARAIVINLRNVGSNRRLVGASTITQQVAKNFLLTNEVSYERKIKEAILAYRMEKALSKDRLLELYLNEIYLGQRSYGVAAAALIYFNKSLDELSIAEAAYLAALPKAPNNYHPIKKKEAAVARRNWVIDRMVVENFISQGQANLSKMEDLAVVDREEVENVDAPFFAEQIRRELKEKYGDEGLYGGGLVVRSTLDPALQKIAEATLREGLRDYDRRHGYRGPVATFDNFDDWKTRLGTIQRQRGMLDNWHLALVLEAGDSEAKIGFVDRDQSVLKLDDVKWARKSLDEGYALGAEITAVNQAVAQGDVVMVSAQKDEEGAVSYELQQVPLVQGGILAMDPHTGRVLAMQGGWDYSSSEYNRATQARRQTGSVFKPFVYLAALQKGFTPTSLVMDAPFAIEDRPGHFWRPSNYSHDFAGPTTLRRGVEKSKNLMTVRLAHYLGMDYIAAFAEKLGLFEQMPHLLSYSLGAGESTLLKVTGAYGMLVNGGKKVEPTFIDRIQNRHGLTVFQHDDRPCRNCGPRMKWVGQQVPDVVDEREQIVDPRTAYQMVSILEGVVQRGTGVRIKSLDRPLAGKTGTTNKSKDAWFVGFSPDLVVGVYVGFDEPRSLGKRETGSSAAAPIFKEFMREALADQPVLPFRIPPGIKQIAVNANTGERAFPGDENVIWEVYVAGNEPNENNRVILDGSGEVVDAQYYHYSDEVIEGEDGDTGFFGDYEPYGDDTNTNTTREVYRPPVNNTVREPEQPDYNPITGTGGIY